MFYEPGFTDHGLPHDPFKSCVVPRPIGWISTRNKDGIDNLAPYSQFTNVTFDPPIVMFSANHSTVGAYKDSVAFAQETGVFGWSMATYDLREAVNTSAQEVPPEVDEFDMAGLKKREANKIGVSLVDDSPICFECEYLQTVSFPGNGKMGSAEVVFGRVIGVHIKDEYIDGNGLLDILKARPIARMGYYDYTTVDSKFEMKIQGSDKMLAGLEGSPKRAREG